MIKTNSKSLPASLPISQRLIERRIYLLRDQQVILDSDLAKLYQVPTKRLNEAVKRNIERFPEGFMFQLKHDEASNLRLQIATPGPRSQFATLNRGQNIKYLPYAFTEFGIVMLSSVLNSHKAIQMNIAIVKAFIHLRFMLEEYKSLSKEIAKIKGVQDLHTKVLVKVVTNLKKISSVSQTNAIGFKWKSKKIN
jgi:hypothetical protein